MLISIKSLYNIWYIQILFLPLQYQNTTNQLKTGRQPISGVKR